ncbi:putative ORFan [Cotonvirus japonicus]|uniref:ORFan n=1 Tax=Cotonvirus japonicus TaxID=2811091 RepID=A0ABM7NUP1_9VIRU|nr:putative ORFan [Cotonvirus japonicus]BCS83787.1 putative ORFan [Cotonvirus japonicus]
MFARFSFLFNFQHNSICFVCCDFYISDFVSHCIIFFPIANSLYHFPFDFFFSISSNYNSYIFRRFFSNFNSLNFSLQFSKSLLNFSRFYFPFSFPFFSPRNFNFFLYNLI